MNRMTKLTGVLAPLPTPFDERDRVDVIRLRAAFPRWLASPLTGFIVLGSNGEAALMGDDECDRVVEEARGVVPSSRPLIVGTGRESTQAAVRAARRAAELGADAVLVRTPGFFKSQMNGDAFVRHYRAVADASPVPVYLYNFTALTGVNLLPATVSRLAEHPNIVGMKESGSDISQIAELVAETPDTFSVLAGSGSTFYAALCAGVSGGILALAGLLPEPCVRLFELVRDGRYEEARALQQRLMPIARLISTGHGVPGLKAALKLLGCDVGWPRPPLAPVADNTADALQQALARFEVVRA
jgi:dihydrodipicolinate synthase/N-acetylneuraminate lyase